MNITYCYSDICVSVALRERKINGVLTKIKGRNYICCLNPLHNLLRNEWHKFEQFIHPTCAGMGRVAISGLNFL